MTNDLIQQLKTYFESDEGKEFVKHEQNKMLFMKQHINKYVEKIRSISSNERNILFEKIKTKYNSNEYYYRWVNRGIEPPECLYDYVLEYGVKYGELNTIEDAKFGYDSYIIDNTWIITCWYGQGSAFNFDKI